MRLLSVYELLLVTKQGATKGFFVVVLIAVYALYSLVNSLR